MPETLSIILASNAYLPVTGGVENSLYHLAKAYEAKGHQVHIICSDLGYEQGFDDRGLHVIRLVSESPLGFLGIFFNSYQCWRKQYKREPVQKVIARHHLSVCFAWLAGFRNISYLVPSVFVFEYAKPSSLLGKLRHFLHCKLQQVACKLANHVAIFSDNMQQQLATIGVKDIKRVLPGVEVSRFADVKAVPESLKSFTKRDCGPVLLCVGRLVDNKGVHCVLDAMTYLPNAQLLIIGEGERRTSLTQQASNLGIAERVQFVGQTTTPEAYYHLADIFVFASLYEPFGQTLLEAAASKIPIVAWRPSDKVRTATDKILPENAVTWVEQVDSHALAQAIEQLYNYPKVQLDKSQSAFDHIVANYSWGCLAQSLLDLKDKTTNNG